MLWIHQQQKPVDLCWYGYYFDRATYDLLVDQVIGDSVPFTWAQGKVTTIADMYDIGRDLQKLRDGGSDNCNDVIAINIAMFVGMVLFTGLNFNFHLLTS